MFSFPPEFPFVSGRKADVKPEIAAPETPPVAEASPPVQLTVSAPAIATSTAPIPAQTPIVASPPACFTDRRKIKRDSMAAAALLRLDGSHGPPTKVELIDISVAGARFRCPRPLEMGEKAQVRLEVGPLRWTTRLRVVHCTRIDDAHVSVGCAFLRTELLRPWPAAA
jgi:hypothetical protein